MDMHRSIALRWCVMALAAAICGGRVSERALAAAPESPPELAVVVHDSGGKAVAGAVCTLLPAPLPGEIVTNAAGKATLPTVFALTGADVVRVLTVRQRERNLAAAVVVGEIRGPLDVKLAPAAALAGRVTDAQGKPVAGATLWVYLQAGRYGTSIGDRDPFTTDGQGRYEIRGMPPWERYTLRAEKDGYGCDQKRVDLLDAGGKTTAVEAMVLPVADQSVGGVVIDVDGKPVAGCPVSVQGEKQTPRTGQTDAEGRFSIDRICPGRMQIGAFVQDRHLHASKEVQAGDRNVRLVLTPLQTGNRGPSVPPSLVGQPLPNLAEFKVVLNAEETRGKRLLVCFWDSEQRPSRHMVQQLVAQARDLAGKGAVRVLVHARAGDEKPIAEWLSKEKFTGPTGAVPPTADKNTAETALFRWGVRGLPWLVLTDPEHVVRAEGLSLEELNSRLGDPAATGR